MIDRQNRHPVRRKSRKRSGEQLESRLLLTSIPYGASPDDTAEFMLGDVLVTVVLFESDGSIDSNQEDWTTDQIATVKQRIREGLNWWEDLLRSQSTVHTLTFHVDFTYADQPIRTGYEPISRPSNDFTLWLDDFFDRVDVNGGDFSQNIRAFNHAQRIRHETNWAFTIVVVNAKADNDHRFDASGDIKQSFAFAGGQFLVTTSERPASSIAHETAHMFWAMDEYAGGKSYFDRRGYYNTQNLNAADDHPNPDQRVRSIMDLHQSAFASNAVSSSALETIGWRDSDHDGVFDVLDVPHSLIGSGEFDHETDSYDFTGTSVVGALPNQNPIGLRNDITLNRISRAEFRLDDGPWRTIATYDQYSATLDFTINVPDDTRQIEIRTIDDATGVVSNIFMDARPASWQNRVDPADTDANGVVSPLDALLVINELNTVGPRQLPATPTTDQVPPYLDVNGDGFVSAIDALLVINRINSRFVASRPSESPSANQADAAEGESAAVPSIGLLAKRFATLTATDRSQQQRQRQEILQEPNHAMGRKAELADVAIAEIARFYDNPNPEQPSVDAGFGVVTTAESFDVHKLSSIEAYFTVSF